MHMNRLGILSVSAFCLLFAPARPALAVQATSAPAEKTEEQKKAEKMKEEKSAMELEASLREERLKKELADQNEEKRRLDMQAQLQKARLDAELAAKQAEQTRMSLEQALSDARMRKEVAAFEAESKKLQAQAALNQEKLRAELAQMEATKSRLAAENSLAQEQLNKELSQLKFENEKLNQRLTAKQKDLQLLELADREEKQKLAAELDRLNSQIGLRNTKEQWKSQVNAELEYPLEPFKDGVLTISDRRIPLNGVITTGTGEYVSDRIDYFNNLSKTAPIFIVIDSSPGGSVGEGMRILNAMNSSRAPIHVVVKSFAASMAAAITTLAEHSYALPNALVLHHQASTRAGGNPLQLKKQIEMLKEWERRLSAPIAAKMGISVEEFVKQMYANDPDGDWEEFADKAVKLKWVDSIAKEIVEASILKKPADKPRSLFSFIFGEDAKEERDENGTPFVRLPRLQPFDAYFLHNPDRYYR